MDTASHRVLLLSPHITCSEIQPLILCCCCPPHITCSVVLTTSHQHRCYQRMDTSAVAVNTPARALATCDCIYHINKQQQDADHSQ